MFSPVHANCSVSWRLQPEKRPRPAFTIVELLVAITIVASTISLIVPAVDAARRAARHQEVVHRLRHLANGMIQFRFLRDRFPESEADLQALIEFYLDGSTDFELHDGRICDTRLNYCYELEIIDHSTFRLCTVPRSPYVDYEFRICLTVRDEGLSDYEFEYEDLEPDPAAVMVWEARRREAAVVGLDAVARMLNASEDPEAASQLIDETGALQSVILASLDRNDDGTLEQDEIEELFEPSASDSLLIEFARSTARQQYEIMSLHRGTYDGIPLADLTLEEEQFTAQRLGWYIEAHVDNPGVVRSLQNKADRIEELRFHLGDDAAREPCAGLVRAFRSEVRGQEGLSISPESAARLETLIGILCPAPPPSDGTDP